MVPRCERNSILDIPGWRLENSSPTKQPPSASPLSFIPVNMLRYLWKGLIPRLFLWNNECILQVANLGRQRSGRKSGNEMKEEMIVWFQILIVHLRGKMNNENFESDSSHKLKDWRLAWLDVTLTSCHLARPRLETETQKHLTFLLTSCIFVDIEKFLFFLKTWLIG